MRVNYEIENRDTVSAQLKADGKVIVEDVTIDLVDGRLTNCYFEVIDAPPTFKDETADMQAALEYLGVEPEV